jgi:hypothetical protein
MYATMADAPPWPNFFLHFATLTCPIIIWMLLLIFPNVYADLLKCQRRTGGTLLHQLLQPLTPRRHHPSNKKRGFRWPTPLQHLLHVPKRCAITWFAAAWFIYRMGCNLEPAILRAKQAEHKCHQCNSTRRCVQATAFQSVHQSSHLIKVRFDSDSYFMGVDGHASYCMANRTDHFDCNLKLVEGDHQVDGIGSGIAIKGVGTFKFRLEDNNGQVHTIRVPNSLCVPSLKRVLLAPHHWAQEAHDITPNPRGTWMATCRNCIILYWDQSKAKRTIKMSSSTNTPMTRTASSTKNYWAYSATIEALKACTSNSKGEHVIQQLTQQGSPIDSDKYIADENLLLESNVRNKGLEEVSADGQTVKANNSAENASSEDPDMSKIVRPGPLTFDPCPDSTHEDQHIHVPSDKQSELMHWHYCLGHLLFRKLKALEKIGEIPKHLANVLPPVCTGCAFGAMTRVHWKNRETTRIVFKATKPG